MPVVLCNTITKYYDEYFAKQKGNLGLMPKITLRKNAFTG
jgi:hypothetical protein